jgi:pathogenesis-related protein 1
VKRVIRPLSSATVALALSACAAGGGGAGAGLTGDERQRMIDAHDAARAAASPAPDPPLPAMSWSEEAAAVAADWAGRCVFEHNADRGERGENLAFFSTSLESTPEMVVEGWAGEIEFYDYATNTCAAGEQCGHYTQVVWRDTTKVGCAKAQCTIDGFDGVLWVCDYEPPGNFVGERPY